MNTELFIRNAAIDLAKIAEHIAHTVLDVDDYDSALNKADECLEEIRFYLKTWRKERAAKLAENL